MSEFEATAAALDDIAETYALLAECFRAELSQAFIDRLRGMRFPVNTGNGHMDEGYCAIAGYFSGVGAAAEGELAADYSRTFLGGGIDSFSAAYPFESVHVARKRLLMQDARDEVLALYRAYGLEKSGAMVEGEDHITYELEFLQVLAGRCAQALRADDLATAEDLARAQQAFLEDHLMRWLGKFTAQMRHFSATQFYQGVSHVAFGAAQEHQALLAELLAD